MNINDLAKKITEDFKNIVTIEEELSKVTDIKDKDKLEKLDLGVKFNTCYLIVNRFKDRYEIFKEMGGDLNNLPKEAVHYYNTIISLSSPIDKKDSKEVQELKKFIQNYGKV